MKKFNKRIFQITAMAVIFLFMSTSVFAQTQETQKDTTSQDTTSQSSEQQEALPQEQNQYTNQGMDSQEADKGVDYSETIDKSELPQEVNSSLDELYPAHEISEVFKGNDDSFKVKVKNEDDEAVVYYNSEGDFLRAKNLSGLQQEGALPQEQGQSTQGSQNQDQWGTDTERTQQGTQQSEMESDNDNISGQQGTQEGTWGDRADSDETETQQGTSEGTMQEDDDMNTGTSERSTQSETQQGTWGTQSSTMDNESSAYPQQQNQKDDDAFRSKDSDKGVDYSETVEESDLPKEVTNSLDELYPAHEISEISKGDDDSFKITVKNKDDEAVVYYSSEGEFLRAKSSSDMQGSAYPQEQGQRTQGMEDKDEWGTDTRSTQQGTQMGTDSDDPSVDQGTQGTWGTGTGNSETRKETQQNEMGTGADKNEDNWGTDNQGAHESAWEKDTLGTSTRQDEGSAYPQEQNQQTDDQNNWGTGTGDDRSNANQQGAAKPDTTEAEEYIQDRTIDSDYTSPQEQSQVTLDTDEDYSEEIKERELPESVTNSLEELYPEHDVDKAYRGNDGSFKVKVKDGDDEVSVFYDSEGMFLRDEKKDDNKEKDTNQDW
jgi:uncharacterized protein YbaA (DUF1428 family)